jgi:predicted MFS family arabinose efflux permease
VAARRFVPESRAELGDRVFDLAGAVSVTAGLVVLVYAIVKAPDYGWGSARTIGLGAVALALLAGFVEIERRTRSPLMRLGIFRIRSLAVADASLLLVASGLFAMFYFASLYVQDILGYSPLRAGFAFLPVAVGIMVGAGIAQQLVRRVGVRALAVGGLVLGTVGMALLTRVRVDGSYGSDLLVGLLPLAIGLGLTFVPITLLATSRVPGEDAGLASGLFNVSQQVGGALGLAVLSSLAADRTASALADNTARAGALVDGYRVAFTGGAVLLGAAAVLLLVLLRRRDVAAIAAGAPQPAIP